MRVLILALVALVGCGADGGGGGGGGGDGTDNEGAFDEPENTAKMERASVECDPFASFTDDLFIFEATTSGDVDEVQVDVWNGASSRGTWIIWETTSDHWYAELWADDISSDCDDFDSMSFEFTAYGVGYDSMQVPQ